LSFRSTLLRWLIIQLFVAGDAYIVGLPPGVLDLGAGPTEDPPDGITPEAPEPAAQQLVDMALSLLLESRQGREYLDMHYWLQGRLNEAWRGR
jgi:hypothetical protein